MYICSVKSTLPKKFEKSLLQGIRKGTQAISKPVHISDEQGQHLELAPNLRIRNLPFRETSGQRWSRSLDGAPISFEEAVIGNLNTFSR